ncbi:MAG: 3-isopropylmalate dehydratase small subunit [Candidatus Margulisiibacteriota bacterium]
MNAIRAKLTGSAVPIYGDDIDTDRIVPARFLKEITFENMGKYLFCDARYTPEGQPKDFPLNSPKFKDATLMVVGRNFGCGSSREHAAQAVLRAGFKAIVGESFSEIFSGNCKALGIPVVTVSRDTITELQALIEAEPTTQFELNIAEKTLAAGTQSWPVGLSADRREAFVHGTWDSISLLSANRQAILDKAKTLPYLTDWM